MKKYLVQIEEKFKFRHTFTYYGKHGEKVCEGEGVIDATKHKDKILSRGYSAVSEARKNCYFGDRDYLSERGYKDAVAQIVGIEV